MPPSPAADRNLLFGILALQMDFVPRDALIAAMNAWVLDKAKPLGLILVEQGALDAGNRAWLEAGVERHLEKHGNDPEQSLAAVSSIRSVRQDLQQIADPDVQASQAHVSAARPAPDPDATRADLSSQAARRFLILRPHAKGGLGEVFVARDEELRREVALKEIQERHADNPESRARFLLEAEVTGSLEHPGIVPVYGLGTYGDGRPFYAMRFVRGDNLKDAIERFHRDKAALPAGERALRLRQLLGRFVDVCQAIAYAHSRGVLHRDLKPGNVMLGKYGETLVVDWGLAKVLGQADVEVSEGLPVSSADSALTQAGRALGTPAYMSPEQAAGRLDQLGPRSDVYSLGATLYCVLTGQAPFPSGDAGEVLGKVQRGDYPRPRAPWPTCRSPRPPTCSASWPTRTACACCCSWPTAARRSSATWRRPPACPPGPSTTTCSGSAWPGRSQPGGRGSESTTGSAPRSWPSCCERFARTEGGGGRLGTPLQVLTRFSLSPAAAPADTFLGIRVPRHP
jgi:serine/threonine-protein kinase